MTECLFQYDRLYLNAAYHEPDEHRHLLSHIIVGVSQRIRCSVNHYEFEADGVCIDSDVLHPFDWEIEYKDIDENEFMINIRKCGFIAYAEKFDAKGILPGICAVDYIVAYYMKNGFHRTKTLGYGDDCCDCRYALNGSCSLKPGKGQK